MNCMVPIGLTEQIIKGNCAIFLGTGLERADGTRADQRDLAAALSQYGGYNELDYNLGKVAEYYETDHGRNSLLDFIPIGVMSR